MLTPSNWFWKGNAICLYVLIAVVLWSCQMVVFAVSMNSTKCPILPDPFCMKLWSNRLCPSQRLVSLPPSMQGRAFSLQQILLEANTIPIFLSLKISIFLQLCSLDSISCISYSTRLMKSRIADWQLILLGCTSKIDHITRHLRISSYCPFLATLTIAH